MTKYTAFRCPEDLLAKAKVKAQDDRRSLSNYLITLIEKDVADMPDVPVKKTRTARPTRPKAKKARR